MLIHGNTIKLLRIPFSFFLMPLFLFALSQAETILPSKAIVSFFLIHFLIYPASNGYNSYIDRDEESIGGLEGALKIPGVAQTIAGKKKQIIGIESLRLTNFGPRFGQTVKELVVLLHPELKAK